jgi:hypothetical protein
MRALDGVDRLLRPDRLLPANQRRKECTHRFVETCLEECEFRTSRICRILSLSFPLP